MDEKDKISLSNNESSSAPQNTENKEKKEPPKGVEISSDYRELFEKFDEKEQKKQEEEKKESERHWPDPAIALKAAVKAAHDGIDLLQEQQDEQPVKEKESEQETEPSQSDTDEIPRFKARGKRKAPALFTGVIVLLLALVGVGYIAVSLGTQIYTAATDDSRERAYDEFLRPVVMQDPSSFSSIDSADEQMILISSLWKALEDNSSSYTEYDDSGRVLVPLADVSDACHLLFGSDADLQTDASQSENFFTFDPDTNQFHVTPYSTQSSYLPYTDTIYSEDGKTVLVVGYVSPTDSWRSEDSNAADKPSPVKYMEYVLEKEEDSEAEYISQIRDSDKTAETSSQSTSK